MAAATRTARRSQSQGPLPPPVRGDPAPQTCRFLQKTLQRLGEDSLRSGPTQLDVFGCNNEDGRNISDCCDLPGWPRPQNRPQIERFAPSPPRNPPALRYTRPQTAPHCSLWQRGEVGARQQPEHEQQRAVSPVDPYRCEDVQYDSARFDSTCEVVDEFLRGWSSQFVAWRNDDEKTVARLQGSIGELAEQNRSLRDFLWQFVTTEEFRDWRNAMCNYSKLVEELTLPNTGRDSSLLLQSIEKSVHKAVNDGMSELNLNLKLHGERWIAQSESQHDRWSADLNLRMDELSSLCRVVVDGFSELEGSLPGKFEQFLKVSTTTFSEIVGEAVTEIRDGAINAATETARSVLGEIRSCGGRTRSYISELFGRAAREPAEPTQAELDCGEERPPFEQFCPEVSESLGNDLPSNQQNLQDGFSIHEHLSRFEGSLACGVANHSQAMQALEEANLHRQNLDEERRCHALARRERAEFEENYKTLAKELEGAREELQAELKKAQGTQSWMAIRERTERLQCHGRLVCNLQEGEIEILKGLEFVTAPTGGNHEPELKDALAAKSVIDDAASVLSFFRGVPVTVECHVRQGRGNLAQLQRITQNKANLVKQMLENECGTLQGQIAASGVVGGKGINRACIRIIMSIWPSGPKSPRPKSPRPGSPRPKSPRVAIP